MIDQTTAETKVPAGIAGVATLVTGQAGQIVVKLVGTVLLSRLLDPSDFGIVAMAATITLFAAMFTDLGLSTATIRAERVDQTKVTTLFCANAIAGGVLAALCIAIALPASRYFGDPRVFPLVCVLSITLPMDALSAQHSALLTRKMRWGALRIIAIVPPLVALFAALTGIFAGLGFWAIAVQLIVTSLANLILCWAYCSWRPSGRLDWSHAAADLKIGGNIAAFGIMNWLHRQGDNLLIGRFWGAIVLGYYARAYALYSLPMAIINSPLRNGFLPILSRASGDPQKWAEEAVLVLSISTLLGAGLSSVLSLTAEPITLLALGAKWQPSVDIFRWLSLSFLVASPSAILGTLMISRARSGTLLLSGIINCPLLFLSYWLAVPYGAAAVAGAYTLVLSALFVPTLWLAIRQSSLSMTVVLRHLSPLALSGPLAFALGSSISFPQGMDLLARLALQGAAGVTIFVFLSTLLIRFDPAQRRLRTDIAAFLRQLPGLPYRNRDSREEP